MSTPWFPGPIETAASFREGLLVVLATVTFIAGCGGGGAQIAGSNRTTTTSKASVSTTVHVTTTTAHAAPVNPPTTPVPTNCLNTSLPSGVTSTTAHGNFDGIGAADTLRAYAYPQGVWHLRVEMTGGDSIDVIVPNVIAGDEVKAIGGFNLDGNTLDEALATVGTGAYAAQVGVWTMSGLCQITRTTVNNQPATFPVGQSVQNLAGVRCVNGTALQVLEAQAAGSVYNTSITNYDLVGTALVASPTSQQTLSANDPSIPSYGAFTCGGLPLP